MLWLYVNDSDPPDLCLVSYSGVVTWPPLVTQTDILHSWTYIDMFNSLSTCLSSQRTRTGSLLLSSTSRGLAGWSHSNLAWEIWSDPT